MSHIEVKIDFAEKFELVADETTRRYVDRLTELVQAGNILRLHPVRPLASSAASNIVARLPPLCPDGAEFFHSNRRENIAFIRVSPMLTMSYELPW